MLRLDRGLHDRIDLFIARPDILQSDFFTVRNRQHILLDIEANRASDRVCHHQRWRSEEGLLGIRVDTSIKITITRQHSSRIQITVDDLLLNLGIQRARHAVTRGTGIGNNTEAELLKLRQQARVFQIHRDRFRARRQ